MIRPSLFFLAALVCACGSSELTSTTIGPSGGTVTLADGATLTIPPGALAADTAITVRAASASPGPQPSGRALSAYYEVLPHGTTFLSPVTLRLPFSNADQEVGIVTLADDADTTWESLSGATINGRELTVALTHLSHFVIVPCGGGVDCGFCEGNCDSVGGVDIGMPDLGSTCGDGQVTGLEDCDTAIGMGMPGWCPTQAFCMGTSSDPCAPGFLIVQPSDPCSATCGGVLISAPMNGDGCCPAGATPMDDDDCT